MTDHYEFWRRALAGEKVGTDSLPIHEDSPQPGFYRKRTGKAQGYIPVAIWFQNDVLMAVADGKEVEPGEVWTYCCRFPVSEVQYRDRVDTGRWWDSDDSVTASLSPPPAGHNSGDPIDALKDQISSALQGVPGYAEVKDDATAAKAQSLRSRLLELSRTADKERETQKKPFFEAGKAVDEVYQPLVKSAKAGADAIAKALGAHETAKYKAEQARIAEQRAQEMAAAVKHGPLGADLDLPPAAAPAPVAAPIKGSYGRAAAVKVVKVAVVNDFAAAASFLSNQPGVMAEVQKAAQRMVDAGAVVPGVTVEEQRKVS